MFSKIDVNGSKAHPLYEFLRESADLPKIPWNFAKFLVDASGQVVHYHRPADNPLSFKAEIEAML